MQNAVLLPLFGSKTNFVVGTTFFAQDLTGQGEAHWNKIWA